MNDDDRAKLLLEAWKKTVDVQQHFNDIEMRVRNLALTILGAVVAFAKFLDLGSAPTSAAPEALLFLALTVLIAAFWFMDKHWYHRLLMGAVYEGANLEASLTKLGIPIDLGKKISAMSPIPVFGRRMHSSAKVDLFYLVLGSMPFLAAGLGFGIFWCFLFVAMIAWCLWGIWSWSKAPKVVEPEAT